MKKKTQIFMNKADSLGPSILESSKILMHEFWYDYVKSKYGEKAKLRYMGTDSFIVYIKIDYIYEDIADAETRFDSSHYGSIYRPLPKRENKTLIGLMKDELGGKIMTKFVRLRAKTYSYLVDDGNEDKKANAKRSVIKRKL